VYDYVDGSSTGGGRASDRRTNTRVLELGTWLAECPDVQLEERCAQSVNGDGGRMDACVVVNDERVVWDSPGRRAPEGARGAGLSESCARPSTFRRTCRSMT